MRIKGGLKAYLIITGAAFGLVTIAHVWRLTLEPRLATDPWYISITVVTAVFFLWAGRLLFRPAQT